MKYHENVVKIKRDSLAGNIDYDVNDSVWTPMTAGIVIDFQIFAVIERALSNFLQLKAFSEDDRAEAMTV